MVTDVTKLAFAKTDFVKTLTAVPFETAAPNKHASPVEIGLVTEDVKTAF
jgi:hypothetical protein